MNKSTSVTWFLLLPLLRLCHQTKTEFSLTSDTTHAMLATSSAIMCSTTKQLIRICREMFALSISLTNNPGKISHHLKSSRIVSSGIKLWSSSIITTTMTITMMSAKSDKSRQSAQLSACLKTDAWFSLSTIRAIWRITGAARQPMMRNLVNSYLSKIALKVLLSLNSGHRCARNQSSNFTQNGNPCTIC
jgi:hypothetical protein